MARLVEMKWGGSVRPEQTSSQADSHMWRSGVFLKCVSLACGLLRVLGGGALTACMKWWIKHHVSSISPDANKCSSSAAQRALGPIATTKLLTQNISKHKTRKPVNCSDWLMDFLQFYFGGSKRLVCVNCILLQICSEVTSLWGKASGSQVNSDKRAVCPDTSHPDCVFPLFLWINLRCEDILCGPHDFTGLFDG